MTASEIELLEAENRRLKAERALRESEQYWRGVFEKLNDGFILGELIRNAAGVVQDWKYLDVNPAWSAQVGIDSRLAKDRTIRDLFPDIEEFWIAEAANAVAMQQSTAFNHQVGNLGRWYEGRIHPLEGDRFTIIFRDVTQVHHSAARRQALHAYGDQLLAMTDPQAIANLAVRTVAVTLGAYGSAYESMEGGQHRVLAQYPVHQPFDYAGLLVNLDVRESVAVTDLRTDMRFAASRGEGAFALLRIPLIDAGCAIAAIGVMHTRAHIWMEAEVRFVRDIAERTSSAIARRKAERTLRELNASLEHTIEQRTEALIQSEEQLRQSQKMEVVGQLTGGIAHDFNNLLTGISGSLEMMHKRIGQGRFDDLDKYMSAAQGAACRAAALTHRLLAFSRRQTLAPRPTDVDRLVGEMQELILRTVGPSVHSRMLTGGDTWTAYVDANQLENALLNLCINARDAMPDGGTLTVETANRSLDSRTAGALDLPSGQYVTLSVSDTGTGMPQEVADKAFEPFFTTKPIGMGTGLGLSMIYGFIRQSGGHVKIASQLGEGTTVSLYLPRHMGALSLSEEELPFEVPRAGDGETVLIVDDEPSVRMLVTEILQELGYHAIEAADGVAGLQILESNVRIDLLVSDVGLPGHMNGRQMADMARATRPELKVLFITGYAEQAVINSGDFDANMHIMVKPFSVQGLAVKIKSLIEQV